MAFVPTVPLEDDGADVLGTVAVSCGGPFSQTW